MNIIDFFKENGLSKDIEIKDSKKTYEESETPIKYIRLNKTLDTQQDVLVLSRSLAEDLNASNLTIKDAEVMLGDNGLYGLIRPDTNPGIKVSLW